MKISIALSLSNRAISPISSGLLGMRGPRAGRGGLHVHATAGTCAAGAGAADRTGGHVAIRTGREGMMDAFAARQ
ncbi:MAG: hypothetical protein ACRYHA_21815 [Janthinobacterium lividum]